MADSQTNSSDHSLHPATKTATAQSGSSTPPTLAEMAQHFPQLEILELIGRGGMGIVYKARQPRLDRIVALKILPAESGRDAAFAERFAREARALAKLNHPGIVAIYDFGDVGPFYYFIMEFVDGVNLRQMIQAKQVKPGDALNLVMQICEALQFAHNQGVVHRDIKPGNILVDRDGRLKIADFGIAKLMDPNAEDTTLTGSHHVMGTPHYMAPEQMAHPLEVDHRADIYSLGVVFYEMLTGDLPVGRFVPPSQKVQVDVRIDEVVLRTLEQERERRYQHVSEIKSDVETIATGDAVGLSAVKSAKIAGQIEHPPRSRTRIALKRFTWMAVLILLAGAVTLLWPRGEQTVIRETPPNFGHVTSSARFCDYALEAPINHRVNFWIEWWKDGQRVQLPDFDVVESFTPARGRRFKGYVDFVIEKNDATRARGTNMIRWTWSFRGSDALSSRANFAVDPFHGMAMTDSSYGHRPVRKMRAGEETILLVVRGDRDQLEGQPWDSKMAGSAAVEMHLKARFDKVPENELRETPQSTNSVAPTASGAKSQ